LAELKSLINIDTEKKMCDVYYLEKPKKSEIFKKFFFIKKLKIFVKLSVFKKILQILFLNLNSVSF